MAKIIRTARMGGSVVTLGKDEGSLHLSEQEVATAADRLDLAGLIRSRVERIRSELVAEWEQRVRDEYETMKAASERQLQETEERHRSEVERIQAERYEEGFNAGVESKEDEAREAVTRLDVLHESLKAERSQVLLEAETTVVDLSVAIARQIIGVAAETDPRVLISSIRSAIAHLRENSDLTIKVHADDLQLARKFVEHWVRRVDEDAVLRVNTSDHVGRGGCMIEGREENVDARIKEQLQALHDALITEVEREAEPGTVDRHDESDADTAGGSEATTSEDEDVDGAQQDSNAEGGEE